VWASSITSPKRLFPDVFVYSARGAPERRHYVIFFREHGFRPSGAAHRRGRPFNHETQLIRSEHFRVVERLLPLDRHEPSRSRGSLHGSPVSRQSFRGVKLTRGMVASPSRNVKARRRDAPLDSLGRYQTPPYQERIVHSFSAAPAHDELVTFDLAPQVGSACVLLHDGLPVWHRAETDRHPCLSCGRSGDLVAALRHSSSAGPTIK